MLSIGSLIENTTYGMIPSAQRLPGPLNGVLWVFNWGHFIWRWNFRVTQVANKTGFKQQLAGLALNYAVGNSIVVSAAAQTVLIIRRIMDLAKQKIVVYQRWTDLYDALTDSRFSQVRVKIHRDPNDYLQQVFSPSTYTWLVTKQQIFMQRAQRVMHCFAALFWEMGKLSMYYMDVAEAFSIHGSIRSEAINDVFLNFSQIMADHALIHSELRAHKDVAEKVLTSMGAPFSADSLISVIGAGLDGYEKFATAANTVTNSLSPIAEPVTNFAKEGLYTLFQTTLGWAPAALLPD